MQGKPKADPAKALGIAAGNAVPKGSCESGTAHQHGEAVRKVIGAADYGWEVGQFEKPRF